MSSNHEADSDLKTLWDWEGRGEGKDASHQKCCNHRVEMVESSLVLFLEFRKEGGHL